MKAEFWLLDVNYEVRDHGPEVWLWGIQDDGKRVLVIDRSLSPYFYLQVDEGEDPKAVVERIEALRASLPLLAGLEVVDRKYFGRPVKAVKVTCQDPDLLDKYAKRLSKTQGVKRPFEEDIRYSMRYLIDNDVAPCAWHEVEVEEAENTLGVRVDRVYLARSPPRGVERPEAPPLRILGLSVVCYSPRGTPKPSRDPVVIVSVATNAGGEKQFVARDSEDRELLEAFTKYVRDFDPDLIVGYGTNRTEWPYLLARSQKLKVGLYVDRAKAEPHTSVYGHVSVTGRANLGLLDFADELPEVKVKTLENVADFLGVMRLEQRLLIEDVDIPAHWEDPGKRPELLRFSAENTRCVMGVAEAMLGFATQLSSLVGLPLDHVGAAAVGFRVEWFLIRQAQKIGELVPARGPRPYIPYAGALVLEPKPGVHEDIAVLDFKAMYPNIMLLKNVSPDTYVPPGEPDPPGGVNVAPEVKHRFRVEPQGFYSSVLSCLIAIRDDVRSRLKAFEPRSTEYRVLDARQKAVKVITNASYGYAGWVGARWYVKPVAEAAAAWGRHAILNTIRLAREVGLEVVYGDTDSVFVKNEPEKIRKVSEEIGELLQLEVKPDVVYPRVLFTEAKKRYCGLLPDGRLDVVGLEAVRGDWAAAAKRVQERVLEIVLRDRSPDKAAEFVRQYISDLRARKVPYRDLVIWKALTMPVEEYAVRTAHVEVAKTLMKEGWDLSVGDKMGYVIVRGPGRLYEKARAHALASYEDVDIDYYVSNQVLPAASRILSLFGVTEEELLPS